MRLTSLRRISKLACFGLVFALIGCVTLATDRRKEGFETIQKAYAGIPESPKLNEVIHIKDVTVHIVGSRNQFDWNIAAAYGSPVAGYANTKNEIWLFGKVVNGKVILNQAILGHELTHILNFSNPVVANPDKLDDLGV